MRPKLWLFCRLLTIPLASLTICPGDASQSSAADIPAGASQLHVEPAIAETDNGLPAVEPQITEIAGHVRDNEQLFANCELTVRDEYRLIPQPGDETDQGLVQLKSEITRCVLDGKKYSVHSSQFSVSAGGLSRGQLEQRVYDGQDLRTRRSDLNVFKYSLFYNAPDGFHPYPLCPHHLLLAQARVNQPISEWLAKTWIPKRNRSQQVSLIGTEDLAGQECVKLSIQSWGGRQPISKVPKNEVSTRHLWLAKSRNYLPVKYVAFDSLGRIVETAETTELLKAQSDLWYPAGVVVTCYSRDILGNETVRWIRRLSVESFTLHPKYDLKFFQELPIPGGAEVRVHDDRKFMRRYFQPHSDRNLPIAE